MNIIQQLNCLEPACASLVINNENIKQNEIIIHV